MRVRRSLACLREAGASLRRRQGAGGNAIKLFGLAPPSAGIRDAVMPFFVPFVSFVVKAIWRRTGLPAGPNVTDDTGPGLRYLDPAIHVYG